jgi:glycosyltransferase involved in cell wall biosynthesis
MDSTRAVDLDGKTYLYMSELSHDPDISVIMAVYNGAAHLREAVESILDQTYRDFEFIIVNDASTDSSQEILESFSDERLVLIKNGTNVGLTKSLTIGLAKARGDYIARMDADDISLPERLEMQKAFLDTHPFVDVVGTAATIIDEDNHEQGVKTPPGGTMLLAFHQLLKNQILHPSVMFRKKVIVDAGGYNEAMPFVQDYELWSRLMARGNVLTTLKTPLIRYRLHGSSITQGLYKDKAYALAQEVVYANVSRYITCTPTDFALFIDALHHHRVTSLHGARVTRLILAAFTHAFLTKEQVSDEDKAQIDEYSAHQRRGVLRWFAKYRFGILYETIARLALSCRNRP